MTTTVNKSKKKELMFVLVLLLSLLLLYNQLNYSENRWTLHPDDHDAYIFSKVLIETGHLWYQSQLNIEYNTSIFIPSINNYVSTDPNDSIKATRFPGLYFVVYLGNLFGYVGPFYFVSITGIMCVLFLYLIVRELYNHKVAMISSVIFGFSAPIIYWSNMLFSNVPALFFFLGGLYYLIKLIGQDTIKYAGYFSIIFFIFSIWIRYDYIFYVAITIFTYLIIHHKKVASMNKQNFLKLSVLLVLAIIIIGYTNYLTLGAVAGFNNNPNDESIGESALELFLKYPIRQFDMDVLFSNVAMYIYQIVPMLFLFGILGMIFSLKNGKSYEITFFLIMIFSVLYYGKNSDFWGYGLNWFASSYTRYFLPVYCVLSIFSGIFVYTLLKDHTKTKWLSCSIIGIVLLLNITGSSMILDSTTFGIKSTELYQREYKELDEFFGTFPNNSVLIDTSKGHLQKKIIHRTLIVAPEIAHEKRNESLTNAIEYLIDNNYPVYVVDHSERTVINIKQILDDSKYEFIQIKTPNFRENIVVYKVEELR